MKLAMEVEYYNELETEAHGMCKRKKRSEAQLRHVWDHIRTEQGGRDPVNSIFSQISKEQRISRLPDTHYSLQLSDDL